MAGNVANVTFKLKGYLNFRSVVADTFLRIITRGTMRVKIFWQIQLTFCIDGAGGFGYSQVLSLQITSCQFFIYGPANK